MSALTDEEVKRLLTLAKRFDDASHYRFPFAKKCTHELSAIHGPEKFILDIRRGTIDIRKYTYQKRKRGIAPLARLDIRGPRHRNPDGEYIECPHLHIYREGFEDKWAIPLPDDFAECETSEDFFFRFLEWCKIEKPFDYSEQLDWL